MESALTSTGDCWRKQAAAGAQFDGDKATIDRIELDWQYDATSGIVDITCTKKPFCIGCGAIETKIRELIEKARGNT